MPAAVQNPVSSNLHTQDEHKSIYQKARRKSGFSFRSSLSYRKSHDARALSAQELHGKEAKQLQPKSDPFMLLEKDQSSPLTSETKTTLASIRDIQHRDVHGNPLAEPDRSNPTRSRWERPLDTIRSFEAAVDESYLRQTQIRKEMNNSRRSSYVGANPITLDYKPRHRPHSYYGRSPSPMEFSSPISNIGKNNITYSNRNRSMRPDLNYGKQIYSVPDVQESSEYVNSATSGSSSLADPAYTTGPSSENSSIDRISPISRKGSLYTYNLNEASIGISKPQISTSCNQNYGKKKNEPTQVPSEISSKNIPGEQSKLEIRETPSPTALNTARRVEKRRSWFSKQLSRIS